ncbi:hypothetical protein Y032_0023g878 [Ancylostoma ceylanicum]|uniref:Endonuclease/exonuclease/phosphatase domain-containing protein n=1 Tax=Ancylostoma ceylanicum TaxID=53326 RepID=A0A016UYN7_9BILA|nr:hypothetical protein Y032_0023g878 [Ancylostoma ceylanicum]
MLGRHPEVAYRRLARLRNAKMRGLPTEGERPRLKRIVRVGSLNIGTLNGKSRELADLMKRRRVDILCLQEAKWKGAKAKVIGDGIKLFCNQLETRGNEVAIAVGGNIRDYVTNT